MSEPPSEVTVFDSVTQVGASGWAPLARREPMVSYGWLRTLEETLMVPVRPRYVVATRGELPVAAAVAYQVPPTDRLETLDELLLGRVRGVARRLGLSFHPALVCGPLLGYGANLLVREDLIDPGDAVRLRARLVDALEAEASRSHSRLAFSGVRADDTSLLELLERRGYLVAHGVPLNLLDVAWSSFDEYLRDLDKVTRGARKDIRRQVNQNFKRGTRIERLADPGRHADRLYDLLNRNSRQHNGRDLPFSAALFERLSDTLGESAVVHVARKDGEITAVNLTLLDDGVAMLPLVAVDHELAGRDFTYFNIAHYRPISEAIGSGVDTMVFGRALYDLKARRGCRLVGLGTALQARGVQRVLLRAWLCLLRMWNQRRLPRRVRWRRRAT